MGDDETIKLLITLQTHCEKLQWSIIQKDMDLAKMVSIAWSLELAKKEFDFLKNNTIHSDTHIKGVDTISYNWRYNNHPQGRKDFKKVPHAGCCKARNAICDLCCKKEHFGKVCECIDLQVKERNRASHQSFTKDRNEYPTMATIKINW